MRRLVTACAIACILGGALMTLPAGAAALSATGWWEQRPGGLLALPPPAPVPSGGLRVAGAPNGSLAIAALRFELSGEQATSLELAVEASRGPVALMLCPTETTWQPTEAGDIADAPEPDCSTVSITGELADDIWTFDLEPFVSATEIDVVLLPEGGASAVPFDVVFDAPGDQALATTPTVPPTPSPPTGTPAQGGPAAAAPPPVRAEPTSPTGGGTPAPPPPLAAPPAQSPTRTAEIAAVPPQTRTERVALPARGLAARSRPTWIGLVMIALGGSLLIGVATAKPNSIASALGGSRRSMRTDASVAGLGRWARPRLGLPPEL